MLQFFRVPGGGALAAGTLAIGFLSPTAAALAESPISGGAPGYSSQLQRAPDVAGSPGSFTNVDAAVPGPAPSFSDPGLTASTKYWWQAVTTDTLSQTATSNQVTATLPATAASGLGHGEIDGPAALGGTASGPVGGSGFVGAPPRIAH